MHLYFIRGIEGVDPTVYYEVKTDVWVFGDVKGFQYFQRSLREAKSAKNNIHLTKINSKSFSMYCTILPPANTNRRAKLRFIERLAFINKKPNMELIIYGNRLGYDYLIDILQKFIKETEGDIDNHLHLDDEYCQVLIKRSVIMTIREPLIKWNKKRIGQYWDKIFVKPYDFFLPNDWDTAYALNHPTPYEEIVGKEYKLSLR